jgi:hypothetical protein
MLEHGIERIPEHRKCDHPKDTRQLDLLDGRMPANDPNTVIPFHRNYHDRQNLAKPSLQAPDPKSK